MRTHCAKTMDPIVLHDCDATETANCGAYKPKGFWYEVDGDWQRWADAESFGCGGFLHNIELNDCNVLMLDTLSKLDAFHERFKVVFSERYRRIEINWREVSKRFDGVEIAPYQWSRRLHDDFMWYYGWDCASGVIWRPRDACVSYVGPRIPETVLAEGTEGERA